MTFLLDTNVVIAFLRADKHVIRQVRFAGMQAVSLSSIVVHELYFGAHKGTRTNEDLKALQEIRLSVLEFGAEDARRAGEIRGYLHRLGTPIGPLDTLIAGQALARDLTLVTRNTRQFERVDGLRLENWEA